MAEIIIHYIYYPISKLIFIIMIADYFYFKNYIHSYYIYVGIFDN